MIQGTISLIQNIMYGQNIYKLVIWTQRNASVIRPKIFSDFYIS